MTSHLSAVGYFVIGTYPSIDPSESIFIPALLSWIKTFYSIAVVLNVMTTGLMSYKIWITHRNTADYAIAKGRLLSIIRILIESAALQLLVEIVLLALYSANINAQYILLEAVTPTVVSYLSAEDNIIFTGLLPGHHIQYHHGPN